SESLQGYTRGPDGVQEDDLTKLSNDSNLGRPSNTFVNLIKLFNDSNLGRPSYTFVNFKVLVDQS
ncbi:hypothetical protein CHS0354_014205, partial [Potamilus streckersoni]